MVNDEFYYSLSDHEKEKAVSFLLRALLKSRVALDETLEASKARMDEDVNIYLAHLMFAVTTAQYRQIAERYLSPYAADVEKMIDDADDQYIKYFIYKVNADHLLIHLGIFRDLGEDAPREHAVFATSERQYSGRATSYYDQAAHFNHRIYHKQTAVGAVLNKLAEGFPRYRDLLRVTRRDFFHFSNTVADEKFSRFVSEVDEFEHTSALRTKQDEFLDLYGAWLKAPTEELRSKIEQLSQEIKKLDPNFWFNLPS